MLPLQEAKAQLSKYISFVEQGHVYTISKNGKPVAKLIPFTEKSDVNSGIELIKKVRSSKNISSEEILDLINKDRP